jgi:short-subunit dehydrogenase
MTDAARNPWALVTGASDGIGVEFCKLLAARGWNLILVARREQKLREVASSLRAAHGVACETIPCDLAEPQAAQALHRRTKDLGIEVDLLVNNAGLLHNGFFDEIDLARQEAMLTVNIVALTSLTHLYLNDMLARGRGRILNISSTAAWIGIPQQNVYAASKAYVLSFTLALADEVRAKNRGVSVTAVCPSYTATKMLDNPEQGGKLAIPKSQILPAELVAREGIEGCLKGTVIVIPGRANRIGMAVIQRLPRVWVTRLFGKMYRKGMA